MIADPILALSASRKNSILSFSLHCAHSSPVGIIALATTNDGAAYSAANLKLLNTIGLQTGTAIRNALLCAEMVESAAARAAYAAELKAASSVQQIRVRVLRGPLRAS